MGKRWIQRARGLAFSNALWWLLLPANRDSLRIMFDQAGAGCDDPLSSEEGKVTASDRLAKCCKKEKGRAG